MRFGARSFDTNFYGTLNFMRAVLPVKHQNRGFVANVVSDSALRPVPNLSVYSASKAAVLAMTLAVAKELRSTNIVLLAFTPGSGGMNTHMRVKVFGEEDARKRMNPRVVADTIAEAVSSGSIGRKPVHSGDLIFVESGGVMTKRTEDDQA